MGWKHAGRYFMLLTGSPWPASLGHVLECLHCIATSGAERSAIGRAVYALGFLEKAGNVHIDNRMCTNPLVKAALEEYTLQSASADSRPSRHAPQVPIAFIIEFERVVIDVTHPVYIRIVLLVPPRAALELDEVR